MAEPASVAWHAVGRAGNVRGRRALVIGAGPIGALVVAGEQPVPMATAIERELELTGSFRFNDEIDHVLQALADGSLDVDAVVTHEYAIEDALTALHTAADPVRSGKVLLRFG